jgi:hypothetical protein
METHLRRLSVDIPNRCVPAFAARATDSVRDKHKHWRQTHNAHSSASGTERSLSSASEATIPSRVQRRPDRPISTKSSCSSAWTRRWLCLVEAVMRSSSAALIIASYPTRSVLQVDPQQDRQAGRIRRSRLTAR